MLSLSLRYIYRSSHHKQRFSVICHKHARHISRCVCVLYTCISIVVHKSFHLNPTTHTLLFHYLSKVHYYPHSMAIKEGFHHFLAFQCTSTSFHLVVGDVVVVPFLYSHALQSFTLQLLTSLLILIEQSTFLSLSRHLEIERKNLLFRKMKRKKRKCSHNCWYDGCCFTLGIISL